MFTKAGAGSSCVLASHHEAQRPPAFSRGARRCATAAPTRSIRTLDVPQCAGCDRGHAETMASFLFRCPNTGYRVQGWVADDGSENGQETYEPVSCLACRQLHLVDPRNGRVLGSDDE
jgi:hypothetical protein